MRRGALILLVTGESFASSLSGDGRLVVFSATATNYSLGGRRRRVRRLPQGSAHRRGDTGLPERRWRQGEREQLGAVLISADGRRVAFSTGATTRHPSGSPGAYVKDLQSGQALGPTAPVSHSPSRRRRPWCARGHRASLGRQGGRRGDGYRSVRPRLAGEGRALAPSQRRSRRTQPLCSELVQPREERRSRSQTDDRAMAAPRPLSSEVANAGRDWVDRHVGGRSDGVTFRHDRRRGEARLEA